MARLAPFDKEVFLYTTFFSQAEVLQHSVHIHVNTYPHLHHIPNINWLVVVAWQTCEDEVQRWHTGEMFHISTAMHDCRWWLTYCSGRGSITRHLSISKNYWERNQVGTDSPLLTSENAHQWNYQLKHISLEYVLCQAVTLAADPVCMDNWCTYYIDKASHLTDSRSHLLVTPDEV